MYSTLFALSVLLLLIFLAVAYMALLLAHRQMYLSLRVHPLIMVFSVISITLIVIIVHILSKIEV